MVGEAGKWRRVMLGLGLFLMVWGAKLAVIERWGTDLPWWDDWSEIGTSLLVPYARGELETGDFFAPHNEHRIAWTRALDLILVIANGQWDARLECITSAAVHALIVVFAFFAGARMLPRWALAAWFATLVALTAPPVVWENIVRGFDSQHYFLIGFSVVAIVGLMTAPAGQPRWWLGLAAAVAALFAMGSGLVAAVVVAPVLVATTPGTEIWQRHRWTLLACAAVFLAGWLLRHEVPSHAAYRASTVKEFVIAFWHHLQWPLVHHAWFGAIAYLPWAWLTWRCVRRDPGTGAGDRVIVAIGLWAIVHYAAMAWMRGALQPWPPTRGLENVVVGLAVNFLALLLWIERGPGPRRRTAFRAVAAAAGVAVAGYGGASVIRENVSYVLPTLVAAKARLAEQNTQAYLATGDRAWLRPGEIPYPTTDDYAAVLAHPEIQALLPVSVRRPVRMEGTATPRGAFLADGVPGQVRPPAGTLALGSYGAGGLTTTGEWRSTLIEPGAHAYWKFDVAGSLSAAGVALELVAIDGGATRRLPARGTTSAGWSTLVVAAPDEPVAIVARDQSPNAWVAFAGPTEVAAGSMFARWLGRCGGWLALIGAVLAAGSWWRTLRVTRRLA